MVLVIINPLLHGFLPVGSFYLRSLLGVKQSVAFSIALAFGFHIFNSGIVENLDSPTLDGGIKFLGAKSLTGDIKIGDIELVADTQFVADLLLLASFDLAFEP